MTKTPDKSDESLDHLIDTDRARPVSDARVLRAWHRDRRSPSAGSMPSLPRGSGRLVAADGALFDPDKERGDG